MQRAVPANRGEEYSALLRELSRVTIEELCSQSKFKQPITIDHDASVWDALGTLCKYDILAAPVVEGSSSGGQVKGQYKGWIDMLMLCSFAAEVARRLPAEKRFDEEYWASINRFRETPISRLAFRPARKETHPKFSLAHLMENCVEMGNTQNQIAIVDNQDHVIGVVTVSMLLKWIYQHKSLLGDALETPLWRIRPYNKVETMSEDAPAVEGFLKMSELGVGGIGLTDRNGKLADTLSCRDLRNLRPGSSRFSKLWNSAKEFKANVVNEREITPSKPVVVGREDTLGSILDKLCDKDHPVHRVFVCNEERHCTDVVTGRDVLAFFWRQISMLKQ